MILQFVINGLITGVLYCLLAVGFSLVYNTTKVFHIAAAALYVFAAYMFHWFAFGLGLPVLAAGVLSIVVTGVLSLVMDLSVYRPLHRHHASGNVAMIASVGMMIVVVNLMVLLFGNEAKVINTEVSRVYNVMGAQITTPQLLQTVVGGAGLVLFFLVLGLSRYGLRFRALSSNGTLFETMGFDVSATRTVVFLTSGVLIALASCLTVNDIGLDAQMGMNMLINAMVAMILGGIGRFGTCVVGGLFLGLLQSVTVYFFSSSWQNAVTFALLLLLLFLRPQGIAGLKERKV